MSSISRPKKKERLHNKQIKKKTVSAKHAPAPAKITPPRLTENVYLRKSLFKEIDNALKNPVVWIAAPPGAGKTTLISTYLEQRNLPCLWYQIDEGDGDIASFFHYMGVAARHAAPRYKSPLPHLTPEYLLGLPTFTRNYFRELYNRVSKSQSINVSKRSDTLTHGHSDTNSRFVIVLDNYQDAPADSPLHEIIQAGLSEIPEGINVIIISRFEPPSAFAGLRANNKMNIIGWNQLDLSTEETSGIVQLKLHKKLPKEVIQELHDKTDGWAAGLVLMLERLRVEDIEKVSAHGIKSQAMFDYFAGEIFHKLDAASQVILLQTAFLPIMTARLAGQLTGSHQAGEILAELNRRNYFTIRKPLPEPVYQYHPLFRAFLLTQARQQLTDAQLIETQRSAAEILEGAGQFEDAVVLYRRSEDWASMARVILANAQAMTAQGRSQTLEEWIKEIPQTVVEEIPRLLYWLGVCRLPYNPTESRECYEKAFGFFQAQQDYQGMLLAWANIVDKFLYEADSFSSLDRYFGIFESFSPEAISSLSEDMQSRVTVSRFAALCFRMPDHPDIPGLAEEALAIVKSHPDINLRIHAGVHLLVTQCLWRGLFANATNLQPLLRDAAEQADATMLMRISIMVTETMYGWLVAAEPAASLTKVQHGLKLSEQTGVHIWDWHLLEHGIAAALSKEDFDSAEQLISQVEKGLAHARLLDVGYHRYLTWWHAILRGDLTDARYQLDLMKQSVERLGLPFGEALFNSAAAQTLPQTGDIAGGAVYLKRAHELGQLMKSYLIQFMAWVTEAHIALKQGKAKEALDALTHAFKIGREQGIFNTFGWLPHVMSNLCAAALEHNIEADYVKSLIKKRNLLPPVDKPAPDLWPFPIKLYTLGRFSMLIDDEPFKFINRGQKKPMELLKALIALGGRDVPQAEIIDLLWPDAEGDASYRSLITCLQRLRNIIGYKDAVIHTEGRMTLDTRYIWLDNWAFERLINHAEEMEKEGSHDKVCDIRIKALGYYKGSFLEKDEEYGWLHSMRERLRVKFIRQVELIGRYWEGAGNWDKALECYQKALSIDNLSEIFYQRLMTAYKMLGRDSEAVLAYQRCCKELSTRMGIPPSPATEEIYKNLKQSGQ